MKKAFVFLYKYIPTNRMMDLMDCCSSVLLSQLLHHVYSLLLFLFVFETSIRNRNINIVLYNKVDIIFAFTHKVIVVLHDY